ncbi:MAG: LacI family DNA-binding transcriptional regulator [Dermatophilus congolensis]|nr:LacI family DNA-binding transcriptional regulator [Dermatophilus congolensis]
MPRRPTRPTLEDVAAEAGVSRASASRALRGDGKVTPETVARVQLAAAHLGYIPDMGAKALASGGSSIIGLLSRDPANPAHGLLYSRLQVEARGAGVLLMGLTVATDDAPATQMAALHQLIGLRPAGVIVATAGVASEHLQRFAPRLPMIRVARHEPDTRLHNIAYDEALNGRLIAERVADAGHHDVCVIGRTDAVSPAEAVRTQWMQATLEQRGCRVRRIDLVESATTSGSPHHSPGGAPTVAISAFPDVVVDLVVSGEVTCLMCASDYLALTVLRQLRQRGLRVPDDVSVTGVDGVLPGLDLIGLDTVELPVGDLAARTISTMVQLTAGDQSPEPTRIALPGVLRRGSTVSEVR